MYVGNGKINRDVTCYSLTCCDKYVIVYYVSNGFCRIRRICMKRIITGVIALAAVLCTFAGCGDKSDSKNDKEAASSAVKTDEEKGTDAKSEAKDEKKEDKPESKDSDKVKEDKKEKSDSSADSADTAAYEDFINEYIETCNSKDFKKLFIMQMPEGGLEVMEVSLMAEAAEAGETYSLDELLELYAESEESDSSKKKLVKIVSVEDIDDEEDEAIRSYCAGYRMMSDYIAEHGGKDKVDIKEMETYFNDIDEEKIADTVQLDDAKYVIIEVLKEDSGETDEEEFYIYRVKGGEWRMDDSMLKFMRSARKISAVTGAKSIFNAGNTAFTEFDAENKLPEMKKAVICSDESRNINVPADFDMVGFKKKLNDFFDESGKFDWFMVVNDGTLVYAVAENKDKNRGIGTYPADTVLNSDLSISEDKDIGKKSFDEVYSLCADLIK